MSMTEEKLSIRSKDKIKSLLCNKIYGILPNSPLHIDAETTSVDACFAAGKATLAEKNLIIDLGERKFSFAFTEIIPKGKGRFPAIVYLDSENGVPNKYLPAEEIIDRGFALFLLKVDKISKNDGNFKSGISAYIAKSRTKRNAPGKISVWAWAAIRVMEYVRSLENIDDKSIAIAGHGLFGKAALLAGALDDRFTFTIANDSLNLGVIGLDTMEKARFMMPHLYCPDDSYCESMLSEQATLISCILPRSVLIGSTTDDLRSSPDLEYEAARAALSVGNEIYDSAFKSEKIPTEEVLINEENMSFHLRTGTHYFSREDWNIYLNFISQNR